MLERIAARIAIAVEHVEEFLLASSVLVIAVMTTANVFCRSVLGFSLPATDEVAQVSIVVLCFTGLSYAAGKGRHIRMTAIYDQLPPRIRKPLMVLITGGTAAILVVLAWYALIYVVTVYRLGGISPALRLPYWIPYSVAPVGLLLAGIQYGLAAVRNLGGPGIYVSFSRQDGYESAGEEGA
jgi:C4-dicarboxylate transporter, DctQ subunit